jgi:hypothetical protein
MFGYASTTSVEVTFPGDPGTGFTTVYGTQQVTTSQPPTIPIGSFIVDNTTNADAALTYYTTSPSAIKDSTQIAGCPAVAIESRLQGLFLRGTLQGSPSTLQSGYRFDWLVVNGSSLATLRLFRADAGALTLLTSNNLFANSTYSYYRTASNPVTYHMTATGTTISAWLSASGQPDTPTITATSATYATGRIGMLSFANPATSGVVGYWSGYSATWTT